MEMEEEIMIKRENGGLEKYTCNTCTYISSSTGNLNRHIMVQDIPAQFVIFRQQEPII